MGSSGCPRSASRGPSRRIRRRRVRAARGRRPSRRILPGPRNVALDRRAVATSDPTMYRALLSTILGVSLLALSPSRPACAWSRAFRSVQSLVQSAGGDLLVLKADGLSLVDGAARRPLVRWRYPGRRRDHTLAVVPLPDGDVLVGGHVESPSSRPTAFATRLSAHDGKARWRWLLPEPRGWGTASADSAGDVLVAPQDGFTVIKLAGATAQQRWRSTIAGLSQASTVATDTDRNVIATASREDVGRRSATIVKMEGATGRLLWRTDLPPDWDDVSTILGANGDVVVAFSIGSVYDDSDRAGVARLSAVDGVLRWVALPGAVTPSPPTRFRAIAEREGDLFAAGEAHSTGLPMVSPRAFTVVRLDGTTGTCGGCIALRTRKGGMRARAGSGSMRTARWWPRAMAGIGRPAETASSWPWIERPELPTGRRRSTAHSLPTTASRISAPWPIVLGSTTTP